MAGYKENRFVYGLVDPQTSEMRYVGSTTVGIKRPQFHLKQYAYIKSNRKVYKWIRSSIEMNIVPKIVIIEFVDIREKISNSLLNISQTAERKLNTSFAMKKWWEGRRGRVS
jgi:hypothetical protein